MKQSIRTRLTALLLPALLLSGCIEEEMGNCPAELKIRFTYEPATYARGGVNEVEVDRVDLFVFDAQEIFRGVWTDENPALGPEYCMIIPNLPAGEYRFTAWCGVKGDYRFGPAQFVAGQTSHSEALLVLDHGGEVAGGVSPLFHASKQESVHNTGEQTVYLPLKQAYNTIHLTTEGLQGSAESYRLTVYDSNSKYKFDYSFANDGALRYTTPCGKDPGGQLEATLNILKLAGDRSTVIEIRNETQGTELYRENLVSLLNAAGFDYETMHTCDIHLTFGLDVSVSINGWQVVSDGDAGLK
jgi:hypothetical protein